MTTAHFNHWLNEHADMPVQREDGKWQDMEDGLLYDPSADYGYRATPKRTAKQEAARQVSLAKAKEARKLAKFYGGKALTGSAKQKSWGESIRNDVLASSALTDEEKEKLVNVGGFTQKASFWIDNKDVKPAQFTAENIVSQYNGLFQLELDFAENYTNYVHEIEAGVKKIIDYMDACPFSFETRTERVQLELDKRDRAKKESERKERFANRRR